MQLRWVFTLAKAVRATAKSDSKRKDKNALLSF
jgi:hypothetical protein